MLFSLCSDYCCDVVFCIVLFVLFCECGLCVLLQRLYAGMICVMCCYVCECAYWCACVFECLCRVCVLLCVSLAIWLCMCVVLLLCVWLRSVFFSVVCVCCVFKCICVLYC